MLLSNGTRLRGAVRVYRPKGRDRLSDFAQSAETFRYLEAEGATYLFNVRHVVELAEETLRIMSLATTVEVGSSPTSPQPGSAIDRLFHAMCQLGASDLHLCVGSPALIRKDGRMQTLDPADAGDDR